MSYRRAILFDKYDCDFVRVLCFEELCGRELRGVRRVRFDFNLTTSIKGDVSIHGV